MKKRYYFSMLSSFLLTVLLDAVYIPAHKSLALFLLAATIHFILFALLNYIGIRFLYKPIQQAFLQGRFTDPALARVRKLTWYSTFWIFFIGVLYYAAMIVMIFVGNAQTGNVSMEKIPPAIWLSAIPSILYIFAVLPAFITWFVINDFILDLKTELFTRFSIVFPEGKSKIGVTLLSSFIILGFIPTVLVSLELIVSGMGDKYNQFSDMTPLEGVLPDRVAILIAMTCAVIFITRSFTKPIHSLLAAISNIRNGDYTSRAAVMTNDEISVLTHEFNHMARGLNERELIRDTFGKYVTRDVATAILEQKINLQGETRLCTILVTDIENYSTLSEASKPMEIVTLLNEYFSELVHIIHKHKGIVNEFIGDSVFALFNVPLDDPDHVEHAIHAAVEIDHITSTAKYGNNQRLTTRIGINTGTVIAGNIGSSDRLKYTVIGDDVNVAARLEQLNKEFGTHILVGENTFRMAENKSRFIELGNVQLKGKEKRTKVYRIGKSLHPTVEV